jgi:hypothetical protein
VRTRPSGLPDNASDDASYFFLPEAKVGCHAEAFLLGAAAITLIFSFLGFLASRFPLCWRLAMSISFGLRVTQELDPNRANVVTQASSGPPWQRLAAPSIAVSHSGSFKSEASWQPDTSLPDRYPVWAVFRLVFTPANEIFGISRVEHFH